MGIMPKKVVKSEPVATPAPTEPVVVAPVVPEVVKEDDLTSAYSEVTAKLSAVRQQFSSLMLDFKTLQKRAERELKAVQKAGNKRKQRNATRAPSGFVKPTLISDQLAEFLGKDKGSLIARTDVTREINAYIRANKLQDPANGRKINPDAKLKKLLTLKPTDELTYFNLQRYMSQHFQKTVKPVV
uniref:DM2 domain-containing protein n=1 Tax=viral metagenome TaxID=1070528 RepID=A0A6C0HYY1_9ZZZZ